MKTDASLAERLAKQNLEVTIAFRDESGDNGSFEVMRITIDKFNEPKIIVSDIERTKKILSYGISSYKAEISGSEDSIDRQKVDAMRESRNMDLMKVIENKSDEDLEVTLILRSDDDIEIDDKSIDVYVKKGCSATVFFENNSNNEIIFMNAIGIYANGNYQERRVVKKSDATDCLLNENDTLTIETSPAEISGIFARNRKKSGSHFGAE